MKKVIGFYITLGLVVLFSSCQPELDIDPDDANPNPPVTIDSMRLRMYLKLDTTRPPGQDTLYKLVFRYDNQQRLIAGDYTDWFFAPDIETGTTEYFYNGNDTQTYKFVHVFHDASTTYRDTAFLWYTNGYISRDSFIEYKINPNEFWGTSVNYFTRTGNNVIVEKRSYFSPGITPPDEQVVGTLFQTFLNGNIISQEDTSLFNPVNFDRPHHTASYDDKKNPFYDMDLRYPVLGRTITSQKNNLIEERRWDSGSFDNHEFYSYTYRPDGYPATAICTEPGNVFLFKAVYLYNQ